jgi:hypothetical protein
MSKELQMLKSDSNDISLEQQGHSNKLNIQQVVAIGNNTTQLNVHVTEHAHHHQFDKKQRQLDNNGNKGQLDNSSNNCCYVEFRIANVEALATKKLLKSDVDITNNTATNDDNATDNETSESEQRRRQIFLPYYMTMMGAMDENMVVAYNNDDDSDRNSTNDSNNDDDDDDSFGEDYVCTLEEEYAMRGWPIPTPATTCQTLNIVNKKKTPSDNDDDEEVVSDLDESSY